MIQVAIAIDYKHSFHNWVKQASCELRVHFLSNSRFKLNFFRSLDIWFDLFMSVCVCVCYMFVFDLKSQVFH